MEHVFKNRTQNQQKQSSYKVKNITEPNIKHNICITHKYHLRGIQLHKLSCSRDKPSFLIVNYINKRQTDKPKCFTTLWTVTTERKSTKTNARPHSKIVKAKTHMTRHLSNSYKAWIINNRWISRECQNGVKHSVYGDKDHSNKPFSWSEWRFIADNTYQTLRLVVTLIRPNF